MANYYVDSNSGDNGDNGTTQALAFATLEYALEAGGLSGTDNKIWIRRTHSEIPTTDISSIYDGAPETPLKIMGWPRPAIPDTTITGADFTNGSRLVDNVAGITPSRTSHTARYITAPDGEQYLLTAVLWEAGVDGMAGSDEYTALSRLTNVTQTKYGKIWAFTDDLDTTGTIQYVRDSATAWVENDNITDADGGDAEIDAGGETAVGFLLDRDYAGSTVTGTDGKFQIEEDEDYDDRPADVDGWDSDAIDLPVIDFNDGNFNFRIEGEFWFSLRYLEFKDSSDGVGMITFIGGVGQEMIGVLMKQTVFSGTILGCYYTTFLLTRIIIEGSGSGTEQRGLRLTSGGFARLKHCAIFNCGDNGLYGSSGELFLEDVDIGVAIPNNDDEIFQENVFPVRGRDVALGGENGYVLYRTDSGIYNPIEIENYQKILGAHRTWFPGGYYEKTLVAAGTPNKKLSDYVIKVVPSASGHEYIKEWAVCIMETEIEADAGSQTFKFWVFNDMGVTINDVTAQDDVWLEAEYVAGYDDTTEYVMAKGISAEINILDNGGDTDWDYLQVTINPATASKVRLKIYWSKYSAAGTFFIDPQVVIS